MEKMINRRRFTAFVATTGLVSAAGCIGGGEQTPDGDETQNDGSNGDDGEKEEAEEQRDEQGHADAFDFPPGANETGVVTETVVAGARQSLQQRDRYRITERHEHNYSDGSTDDIEITCDADGQSIHKRLTWNGVEIDRWVTPEKTVARSADPDADRTGRWRSETVDSTTDADGSFRGYPFEETTVPSLLESASFEFDEIVTESERPYARYSGDIASSKQPDFRQPKSARINYRLESTSGGSVSMLLAESGAVHALDYGFTGEVARLTREGRETLEVEASGEVRFEYDGTDALTVPEWAATSDSNDVREFGITETSLGQTYKLVEGPALPGSIELEYSEFYVMATFGEDQYISRYLPRMGFDTNDGVVADFDDGELEVKWGKISGQDALEEADQIEMSVYLMEPREGRTMIFHEELDPQQS